MVQGLRILSVGGLLLHPFGKPKKVLLCTPLIQSPQGPYENDVQVIGVQGLCKLSKLGFELPLQYCPSPCTKITQPLVCRYPVV